MGEDGANERARIIATMAADKKSRDKGQKEFERFKEFCDREGLAYERMRNEDVLAYIDARCRTEGNAVSAGQWRSQLWSYAAQEMGLRKYSEEDMPFWKRAYKGLAVAHGNDSKTPAALTSEELRRVHETIQPDIHKDPIGYNDWLHLLFSQQMSLRPNEHTGLGGASCVAGNISVKKTSTGVRAMVYTFLKGTTKGEKLRGVKGPSLKAQRQACLADSGREATLAREMKGSPLCLFSAMRPMWALRKLGENPEKMLFPSVKGNILRLAPMTGAEWNRRLRAMLKRAGVDGNYSSRSVRPGRRTDLGIHGLTEATKDQLGRWSSRGRDGGSSAGRRYDRLHPETANLLPGK